MAPKRKGRAATPPPQRPAAQEQAQRDDETTAGMLEELPAGKGYESAAEDEDGNYVDGPAQVLEDEELIGLAERLPGNETDGSAQRTDVADSPRRSGEVATGADRAKKQTAAQQRKAADDAKWTPLKTDGTETKRFERPLFAPYKDDRPLPIRPSYQKGGPTPEMQLKFNAATHPVHYVAAQGFDRKLFMQMKDGTNQYASSKGAGSDDHWSEFKPFSLDEIIKGCGLFVRNGLAPVPEMERVFDDPLTSFVFGDARASEVFPGTGVGGSKRRFRQFRSFLHIQCESERNWVKTNEEGEFVRLDPRTAGPLAKLEPMLSYCRGKWQTSWLPGVNLSLDEMTMGFKGRCALVTRTTST